MTAPVGAHGPNFTSARRSISAPVMTAGRTRRRPTARALTAASLFGVTDTDDDTITAYQFWDSTDDPVERALGGRRRRAGRGPGHRVTAAQLAAQHSRAAPDRTICGFAPMTASRGVRGPSFTSTRRSTGPGCDAGDLRASHGQSIAAIGLFSDSDTDGERSRPTVLGFDRGSCERALGGRRCAAGRRARRST